MNLKKIKARRVENRRHGQLLAAARHIVGRRIVELNVQDVEPAEVVALAFGRYGLRIDEGEALDYLNADLAERGYPLRAPSTEEGES